MTQTPAAVWTPPVAQPRDTRTLSVVAFSLIGVWAASASVIAAPLLLHGTSLGNSGVAFLAFASLGIFVLGMNVWLAAFVCGVVAVALDPGRRVPRALALAFILIGSVAATFLLSGWRFNNGDDNGDDISVLTHQTARGAGVFALLTAVLIASRALLRVGPPLGQLLRLPRALAAIGVVLAVGVSLGTWLALAGRPSVTIKNDTQQKVSITYCPHGSCPKHAQTVPLAPGHSTTFVISTHGRLTADAVRVTAGDGTVSCLPVFSDPTRPAHVTVGVSEAAAQGC